MKKIAYLMPSYTRCRHKFNEIVGLCIDMQVPYEVRLSPMKVIIGTSVEYSFIHETDRVRGMRLDKVVFDDMLDLTDEEYYNVRSRIIGENK